MSPAEPTWVPRVVVDAVHHDQIKEHGGLHGIRDENALESALGRAWQRWTSEPTSDLPTLAAAYAFGISSNHPFRDGNKRAAFLTAVIVLGLNERDLIAPEDEVVSTMLALAAGELSEPDLAAWIRSRVRQRRG